ncbi:hypothetical protein D3C87_1660750 [compost metagenome]
MLGLADLDGFAVFERRRVVIILRQRLQHRLADFRQFVRVERGIRVLVEVEDDTCGKQLVETPDIAELADFTLVVGSHFQAGLGEDVRMGGGQGRRKQGGKAGHDEALYSHETAILSVRA